ncbi:MAG: hypothetical protein ACTSXT_11885 [Candidatus Helarchaeota archaeon]
MTQQNTYYELEQAWKHLFNNNLKIIDNLCNDNKCYQALILLFKSGLKSAIKINNDELFKKLLEKMDYIFLILNKKNQNLLKKLQENI